MTLKNKNEEIYFQFIEKIFGIIKTETGHDFSYYKTNTMLRRIIRKMNLEGIEEIEKYIELLETDKQKVKELFKGMLIGVTEFFRDKEAFKIIEEKVIPNLIESNSSGKVRIWIPACSTGEEAYSIAILIMDYLKKEDKKCDVTIFATDISKNALDYARNGVYSDEEVESISEEIKETYFIKEHNRYKVKKELRDMIIFSEHDIFSHPPFIKLDMISCRNFLIYVDRDIQLKIIDMFHYSLNNNGFLFMGSAENISEIGGKYYEFEKKYRIYRAKKEVKEDKGQRMTNDFIINSTRKIERKESVREENKKMNIKESIEKFIIDEYDVMALVVNEKLDILYSYGKGGKYLEQPHGEITMNILDIAKEGLRMPIAATISNAKSSGEKSLLKACVKNGNKKEYITVKVIPIKKEKEKLNFLVMFEENIGIKNNGEDELDYEEEKTKYVRELEEEIKSLRTYLQSTAEELDSSSEEIRSANEELVSSNEELQSANEELETSKEELQNTNEELMRLNIEIQEKNDELLKINSDLDNLFMSTKIGIIFLDNNLNIKRFTPEITKIANIIDGDIGRDFFHIVNKIKNNKNIEEECKNVLNNKEIFEKEITTEDGEYYQMRIIPYKTVMNEIDGIILTFNNISEIKAAQQKAAITEERYRLITENSREIIFEIDNKLRYLYVNNTFEELIGYSAEEIVGKSIEINFDEDEYNDFKNNFESVFASGEHCCFNLMLKRRDGKKIWVEIMLYDVNDSENKRTIIATCRDISDKLVIEGELKKNRERLLYALDATADGIWDWDINQNSIYFSTKWGISLGYGVDEIEGTVEFWKSIIHPDDIPKMEKALEEHWTGKNLYCECETRLKTKEGTWRANLTRGRVVEWDAEGMPVRMVGTDTDISDRKRKEEEILQSEKKFRDLFNTMQEGFALHEIICDDAGKPVDYIWIDINPAFEEITGLKKEEIVGKRILDVMPKTESYWIENYGKVALTGEKMEFENYSVELDSYYEVTAYQPSYKRFAVLVKDVTDRRKAEEVLRKNEERMRMMVENLPVGAVLVDEKGDMLINNAVCKITGYEKDEIKNIDEWFNKIQKDYKNDNRNSYESQKHSSFKEVGTFSIVRKNNEVREIEAAGYRFEQGDIWILFDVTDRRRAEEALKESERKYRDFIETGEDLIVQVDRTGKYSFLNNKAYEFYEMSPEECIGKSAFDFIYSEDREETQNAFNHWVENKIKHGVYENRIISKNGKITNVSWNMNFGYNEKNELVRINAIARDINERKNYENDLIKAKNESESASMAKSEFLSNMSHELRTPLNGIIGLSEILLDMEIKEEEKEMVEMIKTSGDILLNLISDLLDLSKIEAGKLTLADEKINIDGILKEMEIIFGGQMRQKGLEFIVAKDEKIDTSIYGDSLRIKQILINLIGNSLKFTEKGEVSLYIGIDNNEVFIEVRDTGIGITKEKMERLFEKFEQGEYFLTKKYGGTGLGMAIIKSLVDLMEGTVEVVSEQGIGTNVKIWLKLLSKEIKEEKEGKNKKEIIFSDTAKILVAEDVEVNQKVIKAMAKQAGVVCDIAENGKEVVEKAKENNYNIILMDIQMPEMNGFDATKKIRQFNKKVPIVGVSAFATIDYMERAIKSGMNDYITKPITKIKLIEVIDKWINKN